MSSPKIDSRTYQTLLDDAMARISTHNPEWTNFNHSDPGITLLELFAFLTDTLLYRANLIPERNRLKFLNLLGIPLTRASTAIGIVTLANDHGQLATQTVGGGVELRAGSVTFHTDAGLELLPIEAEVVTKQVVSDPPPAIQQHQDALYASFAQGPPAPSSFTLYETVPLDPNGGGVDLSQTADGSLWIALLLRAADARAATTPAALEALLGTARATLVGATLNLGFVPVIAGLSAADIPSAATASPVGGVPVTVSAPNVPADGQVPLDPAGLPAPSYAQLDARWPSTGVSRPGVVQVTLPGAGGLGVWSAVDPLVAGVGELPPSLDGSDLAPRLITWLRLQASPSSRTTILWAGINAATVTQRTHVAGEVLPDGTGEPDQLATLAHTPVIPESVALTVVEPDGTLEQWIQIDDLLAAPPEIPVPDPRLPPGTPLPPPGNADVFKLDPTGGVITFGDGARGRRPPPGAAITVDYDYGAGGAGNLGAGALSTGIALPAGVTVTNPIATWGGADAESVDEAEKQTARYLQYRDRLVTPDDFTVVTYRTPGVQLGRVEVLAATNPDVTPFTVGSAPGAVTLMVIPASDPNSPDAPEPDQPTLAAIAAYLDPRRLVTTQLFLRGPVYQGIWVSVGIDVVSGQSIADVTAAVKAELARYLAPVDPAAPPWYVSPPASVDNPYTSQSRGWALQKSVNALELQAVASRVAGVDYVRPVLVALGAGGAAIDPIPMTGLQLPRLLGISVVDGTPTDLDSLRGSSPGATGGGPGSGPPLIPVPVIPDSC